MSALILALMEDQQHASEVSRCLEDEGHAVHIVDSFTKATQSLRVHPFDLILSDVHLENGGNVFDFLKWVKSRDSSQHIPFVLLSVQPTPLAKYLSDGVRTSARMLGAAKYVCMEKFDPALFSNEMADLLHGKPDSVSTQKNCE